MCVRMLELRYLGVMISLVVGQAIRGCGVRLVLATLCDGVHLCGGMIELSRF